MTTPTSPAAGGGLPPSPRSATVISHSSLIYWWPVWLVGFVLAGLTALEDSRLAVVPAGTTVRSVEANKLYELTVPGEAPALTEAAASKEAFPARISQKTDYGVVYVVVVLVVIFGSNVPLRGLASLAAILLVLLLTVVFAMAGWWHSIFQAAGGWHIQITQTGYLVMSTALFIMWLAVLFLYDPLRYMTFSPGQIVLHKEIGDMREVFETTEVEVEKNKSDLFRQWFLGFGAGDLIIKIPGRGQQIDLPNVLFASRRAHEIARLMRLQPVVRE